MLLKLDDPTNLLKAIEIISEIVTEVKINVNEFGLSITAIDPANVSMVGFKLPRSSFTDFESDSQILGINLDDLKRILRRCGGKSSLVIKRNENHLEIDVIDNIKRSFSLSLIEVDSEDIDFSSKVERMTFTAHIELNSQDFVSSIDDASVVADACSFILENNHFVVEAKSLNSSRTEFSSDEAKIEGENSKARYSLEYLQKFLKAAKLCERTSLRFAQEHPLRMDFKTEILSLSFVLAPRVETDD